MKEEKRRKKQKIKKETRKKLTVDGNCFSHNILLVVIETRTDIHKLGSEV